FVEAAVRNAALIQQDLSKVTKWIRYNSIILKTLLSIAVLVTVLPALFNDRISYASSLLTLFLLFTFFGVAYAYGFFQVDLSYLHTFLTREEVSKVRFYSFFRFFDVPAVLGLLIFPPPRRLQKPGSYLSDFPRLCDGDRRCSEHSNYPNKKDW
ncbi:MAG: hypothetical protein ABWW66_03950, partial [Archaeoglobaceae archaeon]